MKKVLLSELPVFVKFVLAELPAVQGRATLVALQGNLGAGKTTFVQTLAKELGVEGIVQSPTYVIMKKYQIPKGKHQTQFNTLVHLDLYRLEKPEEFSALQPEQFLNDKGALVVVEWPERVGNALPKPDLTLKFSAGGAGEGDLPTGEAERYIEVV